MTGCELTFAITALANAIAKETDDDCVEILAVIFTQLGDTLGTLSVLKGICCAEKEKCCKTLHGKQNLEYIK